MNADEIDPGVGRLDPDDQLIIDVLVRAQHHMGFEHRTQMAAALKVTPSTFNRWVEGTRRVPAKILPRLSRVTGLTPSKLFEESEGTEHASPELKAQVARLEKKVDTVMALAEELQKRLRQSHSERQEPAAGA